MRLYGILDVAYLHHEFFVDGLASGRVDDDYVLPVGLGSLDGVEGYLHGVGGSFLQVAGHVVQGEQIAPLMDAFFLGHLPAKEDLNYTRIRKVIAACDAAKGNITAAQMAAVACLSERQFLRVFRTYVGIPPKQFIRLRRFHRTIQQMQQTAHAGQPLNLLSIALAHGYYDLSHMALEFQQMGCVSPSHFRALGIPLSDDFSVFFA